LVPLHIELWLVILVQVYGLQQVQDRLYLESAHSSPPCLSQASVVVVVVLVVVVVEVDVEVVVVDVVVVEVVVVEVVVVVVGSDEHFPDTQLSPEAHVPCLLPHRPFSGRGSENWQYQSSVPVAVAPDSIQGRHLLPEQHASPVKPIGGDALKHLASPGSWH